MNRGGNIIVWILIASILFTGCSYTSMVDPSGQDRSELYEGEIASVMMKDSTEYLFPIPPTASDSAIVGISNNIPVSLPLARVSHVSVIQSKPVFSAAIVILGIAALVGLIALGIALGDAIANVFDKPFTLSW